MPPSAADVRWGSAGRECGDHHVGKLRMRLRVAGDRGPRILHVHGGAWRGDDAYGPVGASILGDAIVGQMEDGVIGGAGGDSIGGVDRPARLFVGARPVDYQLIAVDRDLDLEAHRVGIDAVVLHALLELVDARQGSR